MSNNALLIIQAFLTTILGKSSSFVMPIAPIMSLQPPQPPQPQPSQQPQRPQRPLQDNEVTSAPWNWQKTALILEFLTTRLRP